VHSKPLNPTPKPNIEFESLGTHWFVESPAGIAADLEAKIRNELDRVDKTWSRFRGDSLVTEMAKKQGDHKLTSQDRSLLKWYEELYLATNGYITPLIGQTLADAGYDEAYSLKAKQQLAKTPEWDEVIQRTDSGITMKSARLLDVGAAGKGFVIDQVAALFKDDPYLIDAGGDIRTQGGPQIIGLEHPADPSKLIGTFQLENQSICASASNRRAWGEWHHILNPKTSLPVRDVIATWAVADTAMHADGIASALFFVEPEKLASLCSFSYVVMYENGRVYHTDSKQLVLFT
jgi:thiamine biosynthesis lipoprotein